jgi:hypothetical protein
VTEEQGAVLVAVANVLKKERRKGKADTNNVALNIPPPVIHNHLESPVVTNEITVPPAGVTNIIDTAPIAEALKDLGTLLIQTLAAQTAAIENLTAAVLKQKPPMITVAAPDVKIDSPVTVTPAPPPVKIKRTLEITHPDGKKSTIKET